MFLLGKSFLLFLLAGLCEIGGGYLVWQWWRNGAYWFYGAAGAALLFLYGIVPTYQPAHFGELDLFDHECDPDARVFEESTDAAGSGLRRQYMPRQGLRRAA